jgi:hypothetical protein
VPQLATLWLNGMAGTGKSAIANTFAKKIDDEGLLGAMFSVDRQLAEQRDPHRIVQSLAYQLAEQDSGRLHALWSSLCAEPTIRDVIDDSSLKKQVRALIKIPLDVACSGTIVILIDGLDECAPSDGARLLSTLIDCLSSFPIKLFVASRGNSDIFDGFGSIEPTIICLENQPEHQVAKDVRSYWEGSLDTLCQKPRPVDWRSMVSIELLVDLTGTLFIYAATVLKIIQNTKGSPIKELQKLLKLSHLEAGAGIAFVGPDRPSPLEKLYLHILTEAVMDNDRQVNAQYAVQLRDILEVVIFAREPLRKSALSQLLDIDDVELDGYLCSLTSVIVIPDAADKLGVIRIFHQSFPEFVLRHGDHVHKALMIDPTVANAHVTEYCLAILVKELRFNICKIRDPSLFNYEVPGIQALLSQHVSAALQYACQYWAVHWLQQLCDASSQNYTLTDFEKFKKKHLLHWIEVSSLLGALHDVFCALNALLAAMKVSPKRSLQSYLTR